MTPDTSKGMERNDDRTADEVLVRKAQTEAGTVAAREAIHELFGRYQERVYQWCFRLVRNHEEALDLAQDAFLKAYRALPEFGERSLFSSWLFVIARNCCISSLRARRVRGPEPVEPDDLVDGGPSPEDRFLESVAEQELLTLIRDRLDPVEQEAIWLRCYERMPVETITTVLRIETASGARGVLQSARRKLRARLKERGVLDGGEEAR